MPPRTGPLPAHIGRFRIDAVLGSGGMGEVYKGFDPTLQRTVAIKTVRGDINNPDYLARLYREAQACARLQHPNIVTVHEAGEVDGVVYIAMEFLKGEDMAKVLERGGLSFEERLYVLITVLDALEHAHGEGVVHRDIKPSNIQRLPDGTIKLVDFGLARMMVADTLTATGSIMGTPHYASPEQLRGQQVDKRTDIYSTGAVAYEMCSGRRPFQGDDDSVATLILKVLTDPLPPMNAEWSRMFPEIEQITSRAMAKSVDERYQSAAEMRDALSAFLASSREAITRSEATVVITPGQAVPTPMRTPAPRLPSPPIRPPSAQPSTVTGVTGGVVPPLSPSPVPAGAASETRSRLVDPANKTTVAPTPGPAPASLRKTLVIGGLATAVVVAAIVSIPQLRSQDPPAKQPVAGPTNEQVRSTGGEPEIPKIEPRGEIVTSAPSTFPLEPGRGGGASGSAGRDSAAAPDSAAAGALRETRPPNVRGGGATPVPPVEASAKDLFYGGPTSAAGPGSIAADVKNAGIRFRMVRKTTAGLEEDVDPTTTFRSKEQVRFSFESNVDGFLYIVQQGSSGSWDVLFPHPDIYGGRNSIRRGAPLDVPDDGWLGFDETPGTESLFVFLSQTRMPQLPGFQGPVAKPATLSAAAVDTLKSSVASRDLRLEKRDERASAGGKAGRVTYVVNREELGKAVTMSFQLIHAP